MLSTGSGLNKYEDWALPGTEQGDNGGLQAVFTTNTFGHYLLVCNDNHVMLFLSVVIVIHSFKNRSRNSRII